MDRLNCFIGDFKKINFALAYHLLSIFRINYQLCLVAMSKIPAMICDTVQCINFIGLRPLADSNRSQKLKKVIARYALVASDN